jgi:trimeric autotransporter adhesin
MSETRRVVTEIIVDARQAEAGLAAVAAASRAAQREFDKHIAKTLEIDAANKRVKQSGKEASEVLTLSAAGLNRAATAADAYRGRLDPLVFAQNALGKELKNVGAAITATDALLLKRKISDTEAIERTQQFKLRQAELADVMDKLTAKTISVADALTYLKTAHERASEPAKVAAVDADALRLKYDKLYASQKIYAQAVKDIIAARNEEKISIDLAKAALQQEVEALNARDAAIKKGATGGGDAEAARLQALRLKYDDVYRIAKQYKDALNDIAEAEEKAGLGSVEATAAREKARLSMETSVATLKKSMAGPSAADTAAEMNKLRASIDPLFATWQKYQAELTKIAEVEKKVGGITNEANAARARALTTYQKEADAIIGVGKGHEDLDKKMKDGTASAGQMKFATQQLTVQMSQMFSGIATGQPILITLIQQGHQVADVMWATGTSVKQLGEQFMTVLSGALKAMTSPMGLLITGAAALVGSFILLVKYAEDAAQAFNDLKVSLSATRGDYGAVAETIEKDSRRIAASLGLSRDEVTKTMGSIAALPLPAGLNSSLEDLTRTAANLGTVLGSGLAGGLKSVSAALEDPKKAAEAFAGTATGLRTLSGALLRNISDLQNAGDKVGATNVLLVAMKTSAEIAEKQGLTPLGLAMRHLNEAFVDGSKNGKNFFKDLGEGLGGAVAKAIEGVALLVGGINKLYELAGKIPGGVTTLGTILFPFAGAATAAFGIGNGITDFFNPGNGSGGLITGAKNSTAADLALVEKWRQDPRAVRTAVSPANALGVGQLIPGTAAGEGVNPMIPTENIKGMMSYLQKMLNQFHDFDEAAAHYNTGPAGGGKSSAAGQDYLRAMAISNPGGMPQTTIDYIEYWGKFFGMSREQIELGKRIAATENAGMQGPRSVMFRHIDPVGTGGSSVTPDVDPNTGQPRVGANKDTAAGKAQVDAYTASIEALKEQQRQLNKARAEEAITADEHAKRTAQITLLIARETDKMMEANRASVQGNEVSKQTTAADAAMLRNRQEMENQRRNDPTITDAQAAGRLAQQEKDLANAYNQTVIELDKKLAIDDKAAQAVLEGTDATLKQEAAQLALNKANESFVSNSDGHRDAVANLTQKYLEAAGATQKINGAREHMAAVDTTTILKAESEALHMQADAGALYVQHAKDIISVNKEYSRMSPEYRADRLKERDALAQLTQELNNQRAIGQYLAGQFDTMFSTIGTAITQAFTQGQGAAVNWGNVTKAVITQVEQALIQLAIINPIKQMFLGSSIASAPTIFDVLGYFGSGATGGVGNTGSGASAGGASGTKGGGLLGSLSSLASVFSGAKTVGEFTGLTGAGGIFSSTGLFGSAGSVANLFATPVFGSVSATATNTALAGLGPGVYGPATASSYTAAGGAIPSTLGTFAGPAAGVVGGFALGSLAGEGIQGMRGTTGPAPEIGAAIGAGIGTAIGAIFGPIGALLGGLAGGLLGGGAGGFIGPKKASPFSSTMLELTDGRAGLGQTLGQGVDTAAERAALMDDITKLNTYLDNTGLKLTGLGKVAQIGSNTPGGFQDPSKFANLGTAFSELRFGSATDTDLNKYLKDRSFKDDAAFQEAIKGYRDLVDNTIPGLMAFGKTTGSVNDAIKELNDAFNAGIAKAKEYGLATDALSKAQADGEKKIRDQANTTISNVDFQFRMRKRIAEGTSDPQSLELENFDQGAKEQRDAFKAQMVGLFGDAFTSTTYYADQMKLLEETLGAERAAIVKRYADQIVQQEKQMRQINANLDVRAMNASSASAVDKALFTFDTNARQERESFGDSLAGIYGEAYRKTEAYAKEMQRLETVQGMERVAIVKQYADALKEAEKNIMRGDASFRIRINNATPGISDLDKRLYAFDINAANEREDYAKSLINVYGESYATTVDYANHIALLEKALGAERLAIITESNDAIAQKTEAAQNKAASAIQSLVNYATGLQTSSASPLSAQDQYTLARNKFNAVAGAAAAGDYNSITQLQGFSDTFLNASRTVYGSGEVYASDFQRVLDALNQVASVAPDTLTASVLATETRTQTAELVASLADLKAAVESITTQLRQNATAPARIAA